MIVCYFVNMVYFFYNLLYFHMTCIVDDNFSIDIVINANILDDNLRIDIVINANKRRSCYMKTFVMLNVEKVLCTKWQYHMYL